jgi:RNA polymerase primary sigma factor
MQNNSSLPARRPVGTLRDAAQLEPIARFDFSQPALSSAEQMTCVEDLSEGSKIDSSVEEINGSAVLAPVPQPPFLASGSGAFTDQGGSASKSEENLDNSHDPAEDPSLVAALENNTTEEYRPRSRSAYDSDSSFTLYLREIGRVKLLTPQEEIDLAQRVKQGDKKARELMIKANLRLVVKIARDYEGIGVPLLDLISEGNIGLMKAVERFDPGKGAKLSTYASWWIKQSIKRALANQSKTIRLPVHLVDKISRMRRCALQLHDELGREPTDEELAEALGTSSSRVAQLRMAASRPTSLDGPIADGDSTCLGELVQDEHAESPYEQLREKTVLGMLHEMVQALSPREAAILRARFGLDGGSQASLDEVGRKLGVTRERIRQIQQNALNKLRKKMERMESERTGTKLAA